MVFEHLTQIIISQKPRLQLKRKRKVIRLELKFEYFKLSRREFSLFIISAQVRTGFFQN